MLTVSTIEVTVVTVKPKRSLYGVLRTGKVAH